MLITQSYGDRVKCEYSVVQLFQRHTNRLRITDCSGLCVKFFNLAFLTTRRRYHQLIVGWHHMMGRKHLELTACVKQQENGRIRMEATVKVDVGIGQMQLVRSRTAKMRNATQSSVEGYQHLLFLN